MEDVVRLLQEAVFDESRSLNLADSIDGACGLIGNQLSVASATGDADMDCLFQQALVRGLPQGDLELEYLERYAHRDERLPRLSVLPLGKPYHNTELWTESERKRSSMYRSFLPRVCSNDQLIVRFHGRGDTTVFWTLSREMDGGGWSFENVERIERLVPHVAHFVRVRQALAAAAARGDALAALLDRTGMGVLHLDRQGRVLEANERARRVLAEGDCLTQRKNQLRARARHENAQLGRLLAACFDRGVGGSMALWRPGDSRAGSLILHVCPVRPDSTSFDTYGVAVQILLVEPGSPPEMDARRLTDLYDLTPSEGRLALLLARGQSVSEIAASTGRKESTVRWHVRNLHPKLGVHRQADLVRLVLSTAVATPAE
ncbi:MAG: helix-turn-helix transcriptional regulator [Acidobacteriota bacterium]|nr:helix-turn-helix transcriptional regulator [Acidobacteriota bacterium]